MRPKSNDRCPTPQLTTEEKPDRKKRRPWEGAMQPQAKEWGATRSWKRQRTDSSLETSEVAQHLDLEILASRTIRELISVVLSQRICDNLLQES